MREQSYEFKGFIQLERGKYSDPIFAERHKFSKLEAYIDIQHEARYSATPITEILGGKPVTWSAGEMPGSIRYLANRWGWGKDSVMRFLDELIAKGWIKIRQEAGQNIIVIGEGQQTRQQEGQRQGQQELPPERVSAESPDSKRDSRKDSDRDKTERKLERKIVDSSLSPNWKKWSEAEFKNDIGRFAPQFTQSLLDRFFSYWTEPSATGKMRFQLEKTWETKRRLNTWRERDRTFKPTQLQQQKLYVV